MTRYPTRRRALKHLRASLVWVSAFFASACLGQPTDTQFEFDDEAAISVLFIGNSLTYSNDLPGMLTALIEDAGLGPAQIESFASPNYGLEDHWVLGNAREAIGLGPWDVVVLQQGPSATEGRPSLLEYSQLFAEEAAVVGARTALYMVWPSAAREFDFDGVAESYTMAAELVSGLLFPVGEAWRLAWDRDPDLALYGPDGFHPTEPATYLAAMVMFEQMVNRSPIGLPAEIQLASGNVLGVPNDVAMMLQEVAVEANAAFALP
ncbi:hypothetical protein ACFL3B_06570 [Gemmatimonadota bacterium]